MILPVVLWPEAEQDLLAARDWYEAQQSGLGLRFLEQVAAVFDRLAEMPGMYAVVWEDVRSCRLRRFPYLAYFRILPNRVEVLAVPSRESRPFRMARSRVEFAERSYEFRGVLGSGAPGSAATWLILIQSALRPS